MLEKRLGISKENAHPTPAAFMLQDSGFWSQTELALAVYQLCDLGKLSSTA